MGCFVVFLFFVVAIGIMVAVYNYRAEKERAAQAAAVAARMGFHYVARDEALADQLRHLHLFGQGYGKVVRNLISDRQAALQSMVFDYQYTVGGGKSSHTYRQTVAAYRLPGDVVPRFELRPEGFGTKIAKLFGYQDINLPQFAQFSAAYLLRSSQPSLMPGLFRENLVAEVMKRPGLCVEAADAWVIFYYPGRRLEASQALTFLSDCAAVFACIYQNSVSPRAAQA